MGMGEGPFAAVSLLEYGGLNLFSRFSEDVATRRAASSLRLHAMPVDARGAYMMAGGNMPRNADCRGGVFAARRFPRPSQYTYTMPPTETPVFITTRHATSLRSSNNCKCLIETFFIARGGKALSIKD